MLRNELGCEYVMPNASKISAKAAGVAQKQGAAPASLASINVEAKGYKSEKGLT